MIQYDERFWNKRQTFTSIGRVVYAQILYFLGSDTIRNLSIYYTVSESKNVLWIIMKTWNIKFIHFGIIM
jgi:hypothetical protein